MTRLFADLCPAPLLAAISLAACAATPPYAPTVLAWPRAGESVNQYQADDLACRNELQTHARPPGAAENAANRSAGGNAGVRAPVAARNADAIAAGAQSPYDVAYAQCMTGKGYVVEHTDLLTSVTAPPRYGPYAGNYASDTGNDPSNADVHPGGYPYYVTYPHFIGTLPFFFFVHRHRH
jgi:hypothetical protein